MEKPFSFAQRLRTLIEIKGITQSDLARSCGIGKSNITRYLSGKYEAKQDVLYRISQRYGVSVSWLMGYDTPMDGATNSDVFEQPRISFGQVMRLLRLEHGITQKELADNLEISESAIGMYERGQREPDIETQEAIADYFNVDMDYLLGRSEIKRKTSFAPGEPPKEIRQLSPKMAHFVDTILQYPPDQHDGLIDALESLMKFQLSQRSH